MKTTIKHILALAIATIAIPVWQSYGESPFSKVKDREQALQEQAETMREVQQNYTEDQIIPLKCIITAPLGAPNKTFWRQIFIKRLDGEYVSIFFYPGIDNIRMEVSHELPDLAKYRSSAIFQAKRNDLVFVCWKYVYKVNLNK